MEGPYRAAGTVADATCPHCRADTLERRSVGHVSVKECPSCRGVWVDRATLGEVLDDLGLYEEVRAALPGGKPRGAPDRRPYLKCPRCLEVMNRRLFAPGAKVIVDACLAHGTWFDHRELPAIVEFVECGGLERRREPEREPPVPRGPLRDLLDWLVGLR